jgi:hypothetical protein
MAMAGHTDAKFAGRKAATQRGRRSPVRAPAWLILGALLCAPFAIALASLHGQPWAPTFDMAITELRVRDVFTSHPPLLGSLARLGPPWALASHPGPIAFYLLAPIHHVLGGSAWALQVATAAFHVSAMLLALRLAHRLGGARHAVMVGAALALLVQGYGLALLTNPWNPHLAVLWFVVFLVGLWSILSGDLAVFPYLVVSASMCAQMHIAYVPVCGVMVLLAGVAAVSRVVMGRAVRGPGWLRSLWTGLGLVLLLWLPPAIEQLTHSPGNLAELVAHFRSTEATPLGFRAALPHLSGWLDVWFQTYDQFAAPGGFGDEARLPVPWRGVCMLGAWLVAAGASFRMQRPSLVALHGVVLTGLIAGTLAVSRITGPAWHYLTLWGFAFGTLAMVGFGATLLAALEHRAPHLGRLPVWLALLFVALITLRSGWGSIGLRPPDHRVAEQLHLLVSDVIAGLDARAVSGGTAERYLVTWSDAWNQGAQGYGLANELERAGFDARVEPAFARFVGRHRTLPVDEATVRVHLATAGFVRDWQRTPGVERLAFADPQTPEEKTEQGRLRSEMRGMLTRMGRRDLLRSVDQGIHDMPADAPPLLVMYAYAYRKLGAPAAVFIVPPGAVAKPSRRRR